jgi:enediyne biosynthesis protein E3
VVAGIRAARRRLLTPRASAASLDVRGFHRKNPAAQELLERIGRTFLDGYAAAAGAAEPAGAVPELEAVERRFRGFAYEGAGMGFAVRDGLPLGRHDHFARFAGGPGAAHDYMAYVGLGWAMARLPRFRWRPDELDPLLCWLALDGYGFHEAYFHTRRHVFAHAQTSLHPWPGGDTPGGYPQRAMDQGIGRALWFVGGTDPAVVSALIAAFPPHRRPDLYGGAGLAATYAGGASADELVRFRECSGEHCGQVALGSAFAAETRVRAGLVGPETELATEVLCATSAAEAALLTQELRPTPAEAADPTGVPAYETWRQRVAAALVPGGALR